MKRLVPVILIGLGLLVAFWATNRDGTHSEEAMSHGDDAVAASVVQTLPAVRVNKAPS